MDKKGFIGDNTKYVLLTIALIFIVVGTFRGESSVVVKKAISICLECIGVG
ncbi:CD1871A family CXXC motif-containing protein [Clostridium cellulovorans]|uniref:Thioredoxin n=1 Tax=Clostridium cellulovorans (strain ATCC 35296 / DSM 3052 / OCM 3 / 743B) TaxID=573061 RepID=D9SV70_CLOC7|nr:CD1871A family CXXC motif-containing protein [Clostridium cellulovorans]ADL53044.1 hypothetical protein Clocel_3365 [Clostridium cellulovorans 743B]